MHSYDDTCYLVWSKLNSRGSHIRVACRSICNRDQNGIKRSTFFLGADQEIKMNSKRLKSIDQEPRNRTIKRSRMIFTDPDSWSQLQMLLKVTQMWLPLINRSSWSENLNQWWVTYNIILLSSRCIKWACSRSPTGSWTSSWSNSLRYVLSYHLNWNLKFW